VDIKGEKLKKLFEDLAKRKSSCSFAQLVETGKKQIINNGQFENDLVDGIVIDFDKIKRLLC
jgi:hypothetical protein